MKTQKLAHTFSIVARDPATGQLGALVTIAYPSVPEPKTFFFTFRAVDGNLLIDDILGEITFSLP
mgnify:CR=1 FL=1